MKCEKEITHWVKIECFTKFGNGDLVEQFIWRDLRFELRNKYSWYFKYRAALLQVKYPKLYVDFTWGQEEARGDQIAISIENKRRAKQRKLTEYRNKLKLAEQEWNSIFPIADDPIYKAAVEKISRLQFEIDQMKK